MLNPWESITKPMLEAQEFLSCVKWSPSASKRHLMVTIRDKTISLDNGDPVLLTDVQRTDALIEDFFSGVLKQSALSYADVRRAVVQTCAALLRPPCFCLPSARL